MTNEATLFDQLRRVNLDSAWAACANLGYPDQFIGGLHCLLPDRIMVGRATTLRYVPIRKDVNDEMNQRGHALNAEAAEETRLDDVLCIDACGSVEAGFLGDVILSRFKVAGGAGLVVDGAIRDLHVIRTMSVPVYFKGAHAAGSGRRIVAIERNTIINCGGVAVRPGDLVIGDSEGVLVIPAGLAEEVAERAAATDHKENYLRSLIEQGRSIYGVYPASAATLKEYESFKQGGG